MQENIPHDISSASIFTTFNMRLNIRYANVKNWKIPNRFILLNKINYSIKA